MMNMVKGLDGNYRKTVTNHSYNQRLAGPNAVVVDWRGNPPKRRRARIAVTVCKTFACVEF